LRTHSLTADAAKKCAVKDGEILFSAFFTTHLFAGYSAESLKTSCIKYWAKITHRPVTFTLIR